MENFVKLNLVAISRKNFTCLKLNETAHILIIWFIVYFFLDFVSATCILAVYYNHQPDEIILHTNFETITGKYWNIVSKIIGENILKIRQIGRPTHVFGVALSSVHHASDLVRIRTLYKYGGIFLGNPKKSESRFSFDFFW